MASRTDGGRGSARSLVVRVVASLIVALGREREAAIIFMGDLRSRVETCVAAAVVAPRR